MVRTRIGPSPTGFPHIGTLYQVLFNYAYAKKHNGEFIVRIEDTDQKRSVEGAEDVIFQAIDWLGLTEDESVRKGGDKGPYRQSERLELYKKHAQELVEKKHAYYCFCDKERLDKLRAKMQADKQPPMYDKHCLSLSPDEVTAKLESGESYVIRMNIPRGETVIVVDGIRGEIEFNTSLIDDQVLLKSDGFPTYHLAVVVDDHLMEITHTVRGEEWIPSFPKHWLLYDYFGWERPEFFHTPILRNPDKSKLAKRQSHTSVEWYKENGFLPEAIRNFLGLMGWSHPDGDTEVFSIENFIENFDLKDVKTAGPIFDLTKLEWMNGEYIRMMDPNELTARIVEFYGERFKRNLVAQTIPLIQTRLKTLKEYEDYCGFFIAAPKEYEKDMSEYATLLQKMADALSKIDESLWNAENIGNVLQELAQSEEMGFGKFFMVLRIAITGKKITPPTNESLEILGKNETLQRLNDASA